MPGINDFLDLATGPAQPPQSDFERWYDGHTDAQRLRLSMDLGRHIDPARAQRVLQAQSRTGLPSALVDMKLDDIERDMAQANFDAGQYRANSPLVAQWYAEDPMRVAVAREDFDNLGFIERSFRALSLGFQHGRKTNEQGRTAYAIGRGDKSPENVARYESLQRSLQATPAGSNFAANILYPWSKMMIQMGDTAWTYRNLLGAGTLGGSLAGAGAGMIFPPAETLTIPGGAMTGLGLAWTTALAIDTYQIEAGQLYMDLGEVRGADGQELPEELKTGVAALGGMINVGWELAGFEAFAQPFKSAARKTMSTAIKEALVRPTLQKAAMAFAKDYSIALTSETGAEIMQEVTGIMGEELAKMAAGGQFETIFNSPEQAEAAVDRLAAIASETLRAMVLGGLPGAGVNLMADVRSARRASRNESFFTALGQATKNNKTLQALPEEVQKLVGKMTADGPVETLYQDVPTWNEYWQSKGLDPRQVAAEVLGSAHAYDEAMRNGHDLSIPTAAYATKLAPTEHNTFFQSEVRFGPDQMNGREAAEFMAELESLRQQDLGNTTPDPTEEDPAALIGRDIAGQLVGIGMDPQTAQTNAKVYESFFRTMGARLNVDPMELYQRYGLRITRNMPQVLREVSKTDALDVMLDRIRSGDIYERVVEDPAPQVVDPATLPPVPEKRAYTSLHKSWIGRPLYAWKSRASIELAKGQRAVGTNGRPMRSLPYPVYQAMEEVPKYAKRLIARLRQYTDEVLPVEGTNGGFVLAPRGLVDQVKAELPDWELDVKEGEKNLKRLREKRAGIERPGKVVPALADMQAILRDMELDPATADNATIREALNRMAPVDQNGQTMDQEALPAWKPGDMGGRPGLDSLPPVQVIQVNGQEVSRATDPKVIRSEIEPWAKQHLRGEYQNDDTGWVFRVSSRTVNEALTHIDDPDSPRSVVALPSILKNAVLVFSEPHRPANTFFKAVHHLVAPVAVDGRLRMVRIVVKEVVGDGGRKVYDVVGTRIETPGGILTPRPDISQASDVPTPGTISIGQLLATVNTEHQPEWFKNLQSGDKFAQDKRGAIHIAPGRQITIELLQKADLSTFQHETGHFFLEALGDMAERPDAPEQIKKDFQTILDWFGVKSRKGIKREHHEQWARGYEAYLANGKAPSAGLRQAFSRFRAWMLAIYRALKNLDVQLTPEVTEVYDRLLATDEEITAAQKQQNMQAMFTDAAAAGMTESEFADYQASVEAARLEAEEQLIGEHMAEVRRTQTQWWRDEREKVLREVEAEVNAQPVYVALAVLGQGKMPDGSAVPADLVGLKLDRRDLVNVFGEAILERLPRPYVWARDGGVPLDLAAQVLGFAGSEDLVMAMVNARPKKDLIEAEADVRMRDRYGDMRLDGTAPEKAMAAVHGERRADLLITELKKLGSQSGRRVPPINVMRVQAQRIIAAKRVRDIKPAVYQSAVSAAARGAMEALAAGDFDKAFREKQRELLNLELLREANKAKQEVDRIYGYMSGFTKLAARQRLGKAGPDYLAQVDAILDRYEFRQIPLAQLDRRQALAAWVAAREAAGDPVDINSAVLDEAGRRNYRELTFEELTGVRDAVQNIAALARLKNKLLKVQADREIGSAADEIVSTIVANSAGPREQQIGERTRGEWLKDKLSWYFAIHRKVAAIVRNMDGFKDGGPIWNLIMRPLNEAASEEALAIEKATIDLTPIFDVYSKAEWSAMRGKKFQVSVGINLSKQDVLMVALNWGNEDNRQRILTGFNWSEGQVKQLLDQLDERDWKFVQKVWDHLDTFWPAIKAKQERVFGVAPEKVEAAPIETQYGTFRGGYFPLKYAGVRSYQDAVAEAADIMKRGAHTKATTRRGHTKERVANVDRPVRLDFGVIFEHIYQVNHDLTHHETLLDLNRLIGRREVQEAIEQHHGAETYKQIVDMLRDVAAGDVPTMDTFEQAMNWLRSGSSISVMAWNLGTALNQPFGLTQSMVRIGPKWVAKGIGRWLSGIATMEHTVEQIYAKSNFMRLRYKTQQREIAEIRNTVKKGRASALQESYWYFISKAQMIADVPTWLGAYEKAMSEQADEARAVALADQAVTDAQGNGQIKDLAEIQRGGPMKKLFTNFYSFFNLTFNLTAESVQKTNFKDPLSLGRLAVDLFLLYTVPALLGAALQDAVFGGGDDDEGWLKWAARQQVSYLTSTAVGIRELSGAVQGFAGYKGPPGVRFWAASSDLVRQIGEGEADEGVLKALNDTGGILFHYPSTMLRRLVEGWEYWSSGRGGPTNLATGKPRQKR